jgi:hypothetical protein
VIVNGIIVLVVLFAAGGTVFGLTRSSSSMNPALRTTPLGRGTVAQTVTASGTVTSATSATLNFSTSGKIAEVRVRLGDHVEKGQTVARLDGQYAQANLNADNAQVAAAQQALDDAEYSKGPPAGHGLHRGARSRDARSGDPGRPGPDHSTRHPRDRGSGPDGPRAGHDPGLARAAGPGPPPRAARRLVRRPRNWAGGRRSGARAGRHHPNQTNPGARPGFQRCATGGANRHDEQRRLVDGNRCHIG